MLIDELNEFLGKKFTHPVLAITALMEHAVTLERVRIRAYQETQRDYPNQNCYLDLALAKSGLEKCHELMNKVSGYVIAEMVKDADRLSTRTMQAAIAGAYEAKQ
jgi:hypothetical protein